ncbi:MAG: ATP-binding protein [Anaerolineales bacterium]|nr:ATP-binding protein [Anaerolineales bacterium]
MSSSHGNSNSVAEGGRRRKAGRSGVGLTGSLIAVFMPLVVGPLILLGLILYQQARNNLTAQATAQLNALADIKETEIDRWAVDRTASLISLSRSPDMVQNILALRQTPSDAAARDRLANRLDQFTVLSPDFQKLLVAEADTGRVIFVFPSGSENLLNISFLDDSFFRQGRNTPFFIPPVANPKLDPASPSIVVVAPVFDPTTGVIGVLVGVIRLERFLSFLSADAEGVGASGQVYIIISSGYLLQRGTVAGRGVKPISDGIERARGSHQNGTAFYSDPSGVPVYGAYRWLARYEVALLVEQPQSALYAPLDRLAPTFIIGLGAAILLGVGAVLFFARRITRPVLAITAAARQIAGGDLTVEAPVLTKDEVGVLAAVFNSMAAQLRQRIQAEWTARQALENINAELEQRVLDRTAQLQASNQELEAFAYSVSHDLRGPLRAMEGFSAALLSDYRDKLDEQGQHYLDRIQQGSQRMGQLINDLLNLSRITRNELASQSVDLGSLAREIAAELQTLNPQRQAEFVIAEPLTVQGDSHLLRIALQNLLGNAWKFSGTRQKTVIEVGQMTVSDFKLQNENWDSHLSQSEISKPQFIIYYVRDNGVGFDMDYAAKLFAPFQRLHAMNEFPGTGIGLAIAQRVITHHGGHIWTQAQVGQGATFYFTLGGTT